MKLVTASPREAIVSAVNKYLEFIAPTYGPAGKHVLIAEEYGVKSVDDGKMASQAFELEDEFENAVVQYIREVTTKTEERVGDGTTTSAILMASIVKQLLEAEDRGEFMVSNEADVYAESAKIRTASEEAVKQIAKLAKKITSKEQLYEVAHNSFNDSESAKLISDTLFEIGKDGVLTVEDSRGMTTECEITTGLQIERGYVSPYLLNTPSEVHLEKPRIAVVNQKIDSLKEIVPLIQKLIESGDKSFVIVAEDFSEEVITGFIVNKLKGVFTPLLVKSPGFGDARADKNEDLACVVGATVINPAKGMKLEEATLDLLGSADAVKSTKDATTFMGGKGSSQAIKGRIEYIKGLNPTAVYEIEQSERRIAQLSGGVAVIRVGAPTENEQRTKRAKIEDAVSATRVAFKGGVVEGGGKSLANLSTSSDVLNNALKRPREQLEANGKSALDEKVYDPALVLIAAIETAVSVGLGLANVGGISAVKREKKDKLEVDY